MQSQKGLVFQTEGVFIPKLHLSPRVESLIGGASTLSLPAVPPGACLMDYVERILQLLEQRVRKAVLSFEMRKQFVAQVWFNLGLVKSILHCINYWFLEFICSSLSEH